MTMLDSIDVGYVFGLLVGKGRAFKKDDDWYFSAKIKINKANLYSKRKDNVHRTEADEGPPIIDLSIPDILRTTELFQKHLGPTRLELLPVKEDSESFAKIDFSWEIGPIKSSEDVIQHLMKPGNHDQNLLDYPPQFLAIQDIIDGKVNRDFIIGFLQGIGDSSSMLQGPESSAFDGASGKARVQIEVDRVRWYWIPVICNMYAYVGVANGPGLGPNYPHPTLKSRGKPRVSLGHNHQLRVSFYNYEIVGFRWLMKKLPFERAKRETLPLAKPEQFCPDGKRKRTEISKDEYLEKYPKSIGWSTTTPFDCCLHEEDDQRLPLAIRGKHMAHNLQVCRILGCPKAPRV
ncbi:hypothetical protein OAR96_00485 [Euryarchaeota archaeon]|nr:hypothetical protein [Euryarchaeota archaeon]